jgi:flagellar hook-associated protein FlgK
LVDLKVDRDGALFFLQRGTGNGGQGVRVIRSVNPQVITDAFLRDGQILPNPVHRIQFRFTDFVQPSLGTDDLVVVNTTTNVAVSTANTYGSGGDISYFDVALSIKVAIIGTPAAGDTFTVGPNTNGNADNRNALALAGIQTRSVLAGDTATLQRGYAQLVASIGN